MRAIDRKLWRDLSQLRGQILTISLVVASGIAAYVAMHMAYRSLHISKDTYYAAYRFPDVFAQARRVPMDVSERLRTIPGVARVYPRIVKSVRIPLEGKRAASGQIVSIPDRGRPPLNDLYLRSGRLPDPQRTDEALILEAFAEVNKIEPGDTLSVVLNGMIRELRITGLAMSPEYVFAFGGDVLSYKPGTFAVLWMRDSAVAPIFDMRGAFNDVVMRLQPEASVESAIDGLDQILGPYGSFGAYTRDKHGSHHFVENELEQLRIQATLVPLIFLAVAAFLVNVVLNRIVDLQRGQIAALKALGYSDATLGFHYLKLVSIIVVFGSVVGIAAGAWMGGALTGVYDQYFRFPVFEQRMEPDIAAFAVTFSLLSACAGAFMSVRRIVSMPPAEAMRPPTPPNYRKSKFDWITQRAFGALGRMVVRDLFRKPLRLAISTLGISAAVAILVLGRFATDSIEHLMDLYFVQTMNEDITVATRGPVPRNVESVMRQLPGVTYAEGHRSIPMRLIAGTKTRDTVIQGMPDPHRLRSLINRDGQAVALPASGVLLTDVLAERLGVRGGDVVTAVILEGKRRSVDVLIAGTVSDMIGMQGYMRLDSLEQLVGGAPSVSTLLLSVDAAYRDEVEKRLYAMPAVSAVMRPAEAMRNFTDQQGGALLAMTLVLAFFASVIAIGIVYNNARVSLSMRSRDLASMRVLGFTRSEISSVFLGELAVQVLLALPIGMWLGTLATEAIMSIDPENFRMPAAISARTYAFAVLVTVGAALVSALLVRRKLDRLDLIEVLKTRDRA